LEPRDPQEVIADDLCLEAFRSVSANKALTIST